MRYILILSIFLLKFVSADSLLGKWVCDSSQKPIYLEFISKSQLIYDGEQMPYIITSNSIRVPAEYGYVDYPYTLDKNRLRISFPQGYQLNFKRYKKRKIGKNSSQNSLLNGYLCNYTSSYNGGYSTTRWVYFDGVGRFKTGSGSAYSGSNGAYYGQNSDGSGRYSIDQNSIDIQGDDGYHYDAYVIERNNNAKITGININGRVYSNAVCD